MYIRYPRVNPRFQTFVHPNQIYRKSQEFLIAAHQILRVVLSCLARIVLSGTSSTASGVPRVANLLHTLSGQPQVRVSGKP